MKLIKVFALYFVPVLLLFLALYTNFFEKSKSSLSYSVEVSSNVISSDVSVDEIEVYFQGKKIESLYVQRITIENSGNVPIRKDIFADDINIKYNEGIIYHVRTDGSNPPYLPVDLFTQENRIAITPLLLNPTDAFHILVYSSISSLPEIQSRIEGIQNLTYISTEYSSGKFTSIFFAILATVSFLYGTHLYTDMVNRASGSRDLLRKIFNMFIGMCIIIVSPRALRLVFPDLESYIAVGFFIYVVFYFLARLLLNYKKNRYAR